VQVPGAMPEPSARASAWPCRDVLQRLRRRHAYVQCAETLRPRQLLQSVLSQLYGHKRKKAEGWAPLAVSGVCDFMLQLPSGCQRHCACACACLRVCTCAKVLVMGSRVYVWLGGGLLSQLYGHKRKKAEGWAPLAVGGVSDFMLQLPSGSRSRRRKSRLIA
jgi:hypothetical protein